MAGELHEEALTEPLEDLFDQIQKRLRVVDKDRLVLWLQEERRAAAADEWDRQKGRIAEFESIKSQLESAADTLAEVADWMDRIALPALGDDADGGNSLHSGIEHQVLEIRELLKRIKNADQSTAVS